MKEILLTKGKVALVDDVDYERVNRYKWCLQFNGYSYYAKRGQRQKGRGQKTIYLHRFILDAPPGVEVDHKNRNSLDCRRDNLRLCTPTQNKMNASRRPGRSGYRGVTFIKASGRWIARIRIDGRCTHIGSFATAIEAAIAYDDAARKYHGEFALTNFPIATR